MAASFYIFEAIQSARDGATRPTISKRRMRIADVGEVGLDRYLGRGEDGRMYGPSRVGTMNRLSRAAWILLLIAGIVNTFAPAWALEPLPSKVVVLTFDDSVKSHATVVGPLLKELGFSATFFITEGFDFPTNKQDYMTWEEIRQLHEAGFEIGNHTRDHLGVTEQSLDQLSEQIAAVNAQCKRYGIPQPVSFAYPGNSFHIKALPILRDGWVQICPAGWFTGIHVTMRARV